MKPILIALLFLATVSSFAQSKVVGLFEKCNYKNWDYRCQQVLFKDDSTFEFYDLLHLRDWNISKGFWKRKRDTIILRSLNNPFEIKYIGTSKEDSITISIKDESGSIILSSIRRLHDTTNYSANQYGTLKLLKSSLDSFFLTTGFYYNGVIGLDKEKLYNSMTIEITVNSTFHDVYYFQNEKWLLKRDRLYMKRDEKGNFDKKFYFEKTELSNLKYKKD
jgi:hypothetical protein